MAPKSVPQVSTLSEEYIQDSSEAEPADVATSRLSPEKTSAKQRDGSSKIDQVAQQAKIPVSTEEDDDEEGEVDDEEEDEIADDDDDGGEDEEAGAAGMVDEAADDKPSTYRKASKKTNSVYVLQLHDGSLSLTSVTALLCLELFRLNLSNRPQGLRSLNSIYQLATPTMRNF